MLQDVRYALRQLRKSPGFALTALLTLALGIGANTAILTLVYAVMLKSLPVANPEQLYRIGDNNNCCVVGGLQDEGWGVFSYPLYEHLRDNTPDFEQMAAFETNEEDLSVRRSGADAAEMFEGEFVSGNYFSTFGLRPFAGRLLTSQDDTPSAAPVVVMSFRAWQEHFGQNPALVGSTLILSGHPFTLAGILPPSFYGDRLRPDPPDFYLPLASEPLLQGRNSLSHIASANWLYVIGRIRPGAQPAQVEAKLTAELRQWLPTIADHFRSDELPKLSKQFIKLSSGGAGVVSLRNMFRSGLYLLLAASGLVLLIACANLANLLLARATARRHQMALQLAIGASRARLVRSLLTESVLLACLGGAAGLFLAYSGTRAILLIAFRGAKQIPIDTSPSLPVLAFTFFLSLLTGVIFGVGPAWISSRFDPVDALRSARRSTSDRSAWPQKTLIVVQAAVSLLLLVMAGLVTQSLRNAENVNFGFETDGRVIVVIDPLAAGYNLERLPEFYQQLRDRVGRIPGVISMSYSMYSPEDGDNWDETIWIEGRSREATARPPASWLRVGPDYFKTIATPLLRGRVISDEDTAASRQVAVVDEKFVRTFFPNEDPIGKHFGLSEPGHSGDFEIVGVVRDTLYRDPTGEEEYRLSRREEKQWPMFFRPFLQAVRFEDPTNRHTETQSQYASALELHIQGATAPVVSRVRETLSSIDPNLGILEVRTFKEQVSRRFNHERLTSRLTDLFSILALLLASVGLYGITAYNVARRTSEIGVRMALGADRRDVLKMVLRTALSQIGLGLLIGVPLVLVAGRFLSSRLFQVQSFDPFVLTTAVFTLVTCAAIAAFLPARRAASIEPVDALRTE